MFPLMQNVLKCTKNIVVYIHFFSSHIPLIKSLIATKLCDFAGLSRVKTLQDRSHKSHSHASERLSTCCVPTSEADAASENISNSLKLSIQRSAPLSALFFLRAHEHITASAGEGEALSSLQMWSEDTLALKLLHHFGSPRKEFSAVSV